MPLTSEDIIALKEKLNEARAFERACQLKANEAALTSQNAERRYARACEYTRQAEKNLQDAMKPSALDKISEVLWPKTNPPN